VAISWVSTRIMSVSTIPGKKGFGISIPGIRTPVLLERILFAAVGSRLPSPDAESVGTHVSGDAEFAVYKIRQLGVLSRNGLSLRPGSFFGLLVTYDPWFDCEAANGMSN
jgi:hypothetical protein